MRVTIPSYDEKSRYFQIHVYKFESDEFYIVKKRYSHFLELHEHLVKDWKASYGQNIPKFPTKALINTATVVEERRQTFQTYLNALLAVNITPQHLIAFLQWSQESPSSSSPSRQDSFSLTPSRQDSLSVTQVSANKQNKTTVGTEERHCSEGEGRQLFHKIEKEKERGCFSDICGSDQFKEEELVIHDQYFEEVLQNTNSMGKSVKGYLQPGMIKWKMFNSKPGGMTDDMVKSAKQMYLTSKQKCDDGHWSWKLLAYLVGCALTLSGVANFLFNLLTFGFSQGVFDVIVVLFGLLSVCIEHKTHLLPKELERSLREEFIFLFRPYGRGVFYIFIGTLILTEAIVQPFSSISTILYLAVGPYAIVVGLLIYSFSSHAYQGLESIKSQMKADPAQLKRLFRRADKDWNGYLDTAEFAVFVKSLHIELGHHDLEVTLLELDENHDGVISFEEFMKWYQSSEL